MTHAQRSGSAVAGVWKVAAVGGALAARLTAPRPRRMAITALGSPVLAYAGLAICAFLGFVFLHGWLTRPAGPQPKSRLAERRQRNNLRRMGFTEKQE